MQAHICESFVLLRCFACPDLVLECDATIYMLRPSLHSVYMRRDESVTPMKTVDVSYLGSVATNSR